MAETPKGGDIISQRIRELIGRLGGLKKSSERTGISVTQLSDYQTGKDKPGAIMLEKLARAGGVSVDSLLGFEVGEAPKPYGELDPEARRIVKEVERFLAVADRAKKQHLLRQLRWLREAEEAKKSK